MSIMEEQKKKKRFGKKGLVNFMALDILLVIADASTSDTSAAGFSTRLTTLPIPRIREAILSG